MDSRCYLCHITALSLDSWACISVVVTVETFFECYGLFEKIMMSNRPLWEAKIAWFFWWGEALLKGLREAFHTSNSNYGLTCKF